MLTQEQWDVLPAEEQAERQAEKPSSESEVKEDFVMINGQKRPLKNFLAENNRKMKEEILQEVNASRPAPPAPPQPEGNWQKQIAQAAQREMEETGEIVPVNTILNLVSRASQYQFMEHSKIVKNAQKITKEVKSELKGQYKDYRDYEDEFENILDGIDPQQISKEGLRIVFNSLRGQKIDEIVKQKEEAAVKKATEERKIIGEITPSLSSSAGGKKEKMSPAQSKEMKDMGFDTEQDYLGRLEKKRQVAKSRGSLNIPDLISESLVFSK